MNNKLDHIKRYREIIYVFSKHGFGMLMKRTKFHPWHEQRNNSSDTYIDAKLIDDGASIGEQLRLAFEELGPTFIKLGQILSMRRDILSDEVIDELKKLQDSVEPFPFTEVRAVIEMDFKDKLENIYKEFEELPAAAASLSQVHRAWLFSGEQVAVKVQRPDIEKNIDVDLSILKDMADFIDQHTKYGQLCDSRGIIADFEKLMKAELNFIQEGENADTFRHNFSQDDGITVPKVKWIYTSEHVLTMEYMEGIKIGDFEELDNAGINRNEIAERIATSICNQILRDGFFHADPHPGNIVVSLDGTVAFLDLGMVGRLGDSQRDTVAEIFLGIVLKDSRMVVNAIVEMGIITHGVNYRNFERDIDTIIEKYLTLPMNKIRIDEFIPEIFKIAFKHKVKIPHEFALLAKTLGITQGLLYKLSPDLNAFIIAEPIAKKLLYDSFSFKKIRGQVKKGMLDYVSLIRKFPNAIRNLMRKAENDDFSIQMEMKGTDEIQRRLEQILNQISFSMIILAASIVIAGTLISSSLIADTSSEMYILNTAILKIGLILAGAMMIGLVISMIKSKR